MSQFRCFLPAESIHCMISPICDFFNRRLVCKPLQDRLAFHKVYEPCERIDTQEYWPVMSYSWNELAVSMLWIFTFLSTAIRRPTLCWTFRWSNTDLSRPASNCIKFCLSAVNFITQREGKFSYHFLPSYTWSSDLHFLAWKDQWFGLYYSYHQH